VYGGGRGCMGGDQRFSSENRIWSVMLTIHCKNENSLCKKEKILQLFSSILTMDK